MKKPIVIIIFIISLILIGAWSPWKNLNINIATLVGLENKSEKSGLKVYSLTGEIEVYVNGEFIGSSDPEFGPIESFEISPGINEIKLIRKSDPPNSYFELVKSIKFEKGVEVIISYELGPDRNFSEGHVFYAEKSFENRDSTVLNITSNPTDAKVYIDGELIGSSPIINQEINLDSRPTIKLEKEGYDTIEFPILPEDSADRSKLRDFDLNLEVNMFLLPIEINQTR